MPPIITLTTDFEEREPYVAAAKGVLHTRCPGAQVVDLSHQIPRQSVAEGALFLVGSVPYFPEGTIHIVSVAAGPRPIAVSVKNQTVICPDNGVITLLSERFGIDETRAITHPDATPPEHGQVYFARDVFAPAAALLANGASMQDLGDPVDDAAILGVSRPEWDRKNVVLGRVMHVNRFGALVSNIHRSFLEGGRVTKVVIGDFPVGPLSESYSDVDRGLPLALFGSEGYLEIAYNGDRADKRLKKGVGIIVKVTVEPAQP